MTTATKPARTMFFNRRAGALYINQGRDEFGYWLDVLPSESGGPRRFRLTKFVATRKPGLPDHYDVTLDTAAGAGSCDCPGHQRHGHKTVCKHRAALLLAGRGELP